jgi:hypothetical protein
MNSAKTFKKGPESDWLFTTAVQALKTISACSSSGSESRTVFFSFHESGEKALRMEPHVLFTRESGRALRKQALDARKAELAEFFGICVENAYPPEEVALDLARDIHFSPERPDGMYQSLLLQLRVYYAHHVHHEGRGSDEGEGQGGGQMQMADGRVRRIEALFCEAMAPRTEPLLIRANVNDCVEALRVALQSKYIPLFPDCRVEFRAQARTEPLSQAPKGHSISHYVYNVRLQLSGLTKHQEIGPQKTGTALHHCILQFKERRLQAERYFG